MKEICWKWILLMSLAVPLMSCDEDEPVVEIPKDEVISLRVNGTEWTSQISSAIINLSTNTFEIIAHDNLGEPNQTSIIMNLKVEGDSLKSYPVTRPQDGENNITWSEGGTFFIGSSCRPVEGEIRLLLLDRGAQRLSANFSGSLCDLESGQTIEISNGRINDIEYTE